jgi:hypothetical protein
MAPRIARLDWSFILPPSFAVRLERGAVWRSKQIGVCAFSSGFSFRRASQFERFTPVGSARRHYTLARFRAQWKDAAVLPSQCRLRRNQIESR